MGKARNKTVKSPSKRIPVMIKADITIEPSEGDVARVIAAWIV